MFTDAVWVCKHSTFSSVVLSNIAIAGKCEKSKTSEAVADTGREGGLGWPSCWAPWEMEEPQALYQVSFVSSAA